MAIHYGTAIAERVICETPRRLRVGFATRDDVEGTETFYALHPVTREIRVRTGRTGDDTAGGAVWREAHHIPPGAEYIGRCGRLSETARIRFAD